MSSGGNVYLVDDDPYIMELAATLLTDAGYRVARNTSSRQALDEIVEQAPNIVVLDIMMPELDGLELCTRLREHAELTDTTIIMLSAKSYESDRSRAYHLGANGFIEKPIDAKTFVNQIEAIAAKPITLTFWGVHGTLPVPGEHTVRYGGNTSCISVALPKERLFIFDAGTGIKNLSDHLMSDTERHISAKIFISHPHWDHINALPFFAPLYISGNEFEICGPAQGDRTMEDLISAQMDNVYFPITIKEFCARVSFKDLREDTYNIDGIEVQTLLLTHPGHCLGYRINHQGRSICYMTDNELYPEMSSSYSAHDKGRLINFATNADILIIDSTYFDQEYLSKEHWGHSCLSEVARFAHQASVKQLYLFHHDPAHSDDDIDKKLEIVQKKLEKMGSKTVCIAPKEKDTITL